LSINESTQTTYPKIIIIALVPVLTIHAINETTTNTSTRQPQQASTNVSFSSSVTVYATGPKHSFKDSLAPVLLNP